MLTMIIMVALFVGFGRLFDFGLRIFGRLIRWMIGAAIALAVIGGLFALAGAVLGLAFRLLPVIALVALGIFIGRRIGGEGRIDRYRDCNNIIDG